MRIYFMLAYARNVCDPNPVLQHVFQLLHQAGCQVEIGVASELLWNSSDMVVDADLYVLKSHTQFWLSLAELLPGDAEQDREGAPHERCRGAGAGSLGARQPGAFVSNSG
jgi:hypothetical protein